MSSINDNMRIWITILSEVEAGSKDKHVALVSKAYLVLLLHILVEKFILIHAAMRIEYE